jgi:transcriptional regulator with GAF, ATPase, and Fis domain
MADGKPHIDVDLLPDAVLGLERRRAPLTVAERGSLRERMEEVEREIIRRALAEHDGVLRRAAEDLGANPVTLGRRAKRYGLI